MPAIQKHCNSLIPVFITERMSNNKSIKRRTKMRKHGIRFTDWLFVTSCLSRNCSRVACKLLLFPFIEHICFKWSICKNWTDICVWSNINLRHLYHITSANLRHSTFNFSPWDVRLVLARMKSTFNNQVGSIDFVRIMACDWSIVTNTALWLVDNDNILTPVNSRTCVTQVWQC